jgi:cytochrome c-type biogenesis protein CcmH
LNIIFFLIATGMVLVAFAFVLQPLWRKSPAAVVDAPVDQDQRNIMIARQRLVELEEQRRTGVLSQTQYDEQFVELEQALSDDLDIKSKVIQSTSQGRWIFYVLVLAVPLLAGSLYFTLGNVQAISHSEEMAKANPETPNAQDINKMVEGLAERLKTSPDDANGWLMLGRSYQQLEQYPKAVNAFANAYRLLGDQVEVMLQYAEAIAFANDKSLNGKPSELINKALSLEPENLNALWLGGMMKAQQNDRPGAITLWRKLEALLPANIPEAKKEIQVAIANLENTTPGAVKQPESEQAAVATTVSVDIEVSLSSDYQKSVVPDDTVFIYAQALSGPKMPLAIVRKKVSDLPIKVSLDDTMAMMPTMKLSNFQNVKLLARISKSGNAMTQPGDLIGVIEQVSLSDSGKSNKIVINSEVK